jgi:hypothetical protein
MTQNDKPRIAMKSNFTKSMTLRYLFALSVLALIAVASDHILQKEIEAERHRGAVINLSAQQRMLSQHATFYAIRLTHSRSTSEREGLRRELATAIAGIDSAFNDLTNGDSTLSSSNHSSGEVQAIYFSPPPSLRKKVQKFLAASKALCQAPEGELKQDNPNLQYIAAGSTELLSSLNELVEQYQKESEEGILRLQRLERTVMVITIFMLLMMAMFIFRPMVKRLQTYLVERKQAEVEREKLIIELREALTNVKTLRGLLPICAACKKIRDDSGYWNTLEDYIVRHSEADFTHGFCPECKKKFDEE